MHAIDTAYDLAVLILSAVFAAGSAQAAFDPANTAPRAWRMAWPALFVCLAAWSAARLLR